jgi:hypothetical protein
LIEKLGRLGSYEHWVGSFRGWVSECFFACYGEREREREREHKKEKGWKFERGRVKLKLRIGSVCKSLDDCQLNKLPHTYIHTYIHTYYYNNEELVILAWPHPKEIIIN